MAGHNKWTQIKRKKGVADAKKSKLFSMLAKTIQLEARKSNGDRNAAGLKAAIERARTANLPNENIERAIKNALGTDASILTEVRYECYGPGGVAMIIEGITDNRNRTAQEIKHLLTEHGASLAAPGSAAWAFNKTANGWQSKTERALAAEDLTELNQLIEKLRAHDDVQEIFYENYRH